MERTSHEHLAPHSCVGLVLRWPSSGASLALCFFCQKMQKPHHCPIMPEHSIKHPPNRDTVFPWESVSENRLY